MYSTPTTILNAALESIEDDDVDEQEQVHRYIEDKTSAAQQVGIRLTGTAR